MLQNDEALGESPTKAEIFNECTAIYIHVGFCKKLLSKEGNEGGSYKRCALCKGSNSSRNRIQYMMYLVPLDDIGL